jgi:hypothetical protein
MGTEQNVWIGLNTVLQNHCLSISWLGSPFIFQQSVCDWPTHNSRHASWSLFTLQFTVLRPPPPPPPPPLSAPLFVELFSIANQANLILEMISSPICSQAGITVCRLCCSHCTVILTIWCIFYSILPDFAVICIKRTKQTMKILLQDVVKENVVSSILRRGRRHLSSARALLYTLPEAVTRRWQTPCSPC